MNKIWAKKDMVSEGISRSRKKPRESLGQEERGKSQELARPRHCSEGGRGSIHLQGIPLGKQCFHSTLDTHMAPTVDEAVCWVGEKVAEQHTGLHCTLLSEEKMSPFIW